MKVIFTTIFLSFLLLPFLNAQSPESCGTDERIRQAFAENPALEDWFNEYNQWIAENEGHFSQQPEGGSYIIPVVVHVIHNYGTENISDAQIADAIRILNEDFQKINADTSDVISQFKSIIGNADFEFRLAKKDPNGNCTNGITRTVSNLTYDAGDNVKYLISWPRAKYFNIWVVNGIDNGGQPGITAGYAYLPGFSPNATVDGIILDHRYVGGIGASGGTNFAKRTITHEAGHFFGLLHPWGTAACGSGCGNDQVNDTPTTSGACNTCNTSQVTCGSLDNIQNFMDYALCSKMFTIGQATRMQAAITNSAGSRNQLWTNTNRVATGTNDGFINSCAPIADFSANRISICVGDAVSFKDVSWNATPTSWQWTFTNGNVTLNATDQNPLVTFNTTGIYQVSLTVGAPGGTNSITKTKFIHVYDPSPNQVNWIYYDSFDNGPLATNRWNTPWTQTPSSGWEETTLASYTAPNALRINNFTGAAGRTYNLISPSYDLSYLDGTLKMTYKYAYTTKTGGANNDELKVYISSNCGQTWSLRNTLSGSSLSTAPVQSSSWAPSSLAQWKTDSIGNIGSWANRDNVRFRFEFSSGGGNNFYLDDINISNITGIEDEEADNIWLRIYPNPATGSFKLKLSLVKNEPVALSIKDLLGREILVKDLGYIGAGQHEIPIDISHLVTSGIYIVQTMIGGRSYTEKLRIE